MKGPFAFAACAALLLASPAISAQIEVTIDELGEFERKQDNKFGVGFVPRMGDGDASEQMLFRFVGEMPEVDQMFVIYTVPQMLETLIQLKKAGKKLDYLVLAGHGSKETPGLRWGGYDPKYKDQQDLIRQDIDLAWLRQQLQVAKAWQKPDRSAREKMEGAAAEVKLTEQIRLVEQIPGVMAKDGTVMLINCSAAATADGQQYVDALGRLLVGQEGGQIISSRNDIILREVEDIYDQVGELFRKATVQPWGAPFISGDWVSLRIPSGSAWGVNNPPDQPKQPPVTKEPKTPDVNAKGSFGLVEKQLGSVPGPGEGNNHKISGTMSEDRFSVTVEMKPPYEGMATVAHTFNRGKLASTLKPGDIIELHVVSLANKEGRDAPNVGSGAHWGVEGSVEILESRKTFAGQASNGTFYPASSGTTRFKVLSGGTIKIVAIQGGHLWGSSTNWNPVTYIYKFGEAPKASPAGG